MGKTPMELLRSIEERVQAAQRPVVVFDLDSTLFDTGGRHLAIIREWSQEHAPELQPWTQTLTPDDFGWFVHGPLYRDGYAIDERVASLNDHFLQRFFTDLVRVDLPAPGAVRWVKTVHDAGAWVYYLTGRNRLNMGAATIEQLSAHGFPILCHRTLLHMKPSTDLDEIRFKQDAMKTIASLGTVVATFENDPGHANSFLRAFPGASNVLLGRVCSPNSPAPSAGLIALSGFE